MVTSMAVGEINKYQHRSLVEKALGRKLDYNEVIHHKNGDKTDNRPENLEVVSRAEHLKMHGISRWMHTHL